MEIKNEGTIASDYEDYAVMIVLYNSLVTDYNIVTGALIELDGFSRDKYKREIDIYCSQKGVRKDKNRNCRQKN